MNIFITVGTTPFDKLISYCDNNIDVGKHVVKSQISNLAKFKPVNFSSFAYTENISEMYAWADVVIAHSGAGTLFQLLEMNKKSIFVPNNIHKDNHQNDLCRFVLENNYAYVLNDYSELNMFLESIGDCHFATYEKGDSGVAEFVVDLICSKDI